MEVQDALDMDISIARTRIQCVWAPRGTQVQLSATSRAVSRVRGEEMQREFVSFRTASGAL
eukprot:8863544-Pyramimonas_sp.AAC.1